MNNKNIIDVNETDFESRVLEESVNRLIVVDFWAPWCGPCKQLTPVLEKLISSSPDKITLAKINIDENQQIAAQLRIQSIPAVFAFKDKQLVNAFQGVISEKEIIKFLEKSLGEKLDNNFDDFYLEMENLISDKNFDQAKSMLETFISDNSREIKGISLYAECLLNMNELDSAKELLDSLDEKFLNDEGIKNIYKRIEMRNKQVSGPSIDHLIEKLASSPNNLEIVFKIADSYFASNKFNEAFEILLEYYPKNQNQVKEKILNFFDVLGFKHESVILFRKKLSSIMFS